MSKKTKGNKEARKPKQAPKAAPPVPGGLTALPSAPRVMPGKR
jgi:hypothetical protein